MAQMPEEGRKFTIVDKDWRAIMTASVVDTKALVVTDQPNMLATLRRANELLEEIQKVYACSLSPENLLKFPPVSSADSFFLPLFLVLCFSLF